MGMWEHLTSASWEQQMVKHLMRKGKVQPLACVVAVRMLCWVAYEADTAATAACHMGPSTACLGVLHYFCLPSSPEEGLLLLFLASLLLAGLLG